MNISNTITTGSVVVIKYPSDEVVVGEVVEINNDKIVLKKPYKLQDSVHPQTGAQFTMVTPWNRFATDELTEIQLKSVLGISLANAFLINQLNQYTQMVARAKETSPSGVDDILAEYLKTKFGYFHPGNDTVH